MNHEFLTEELPSDSELFALFKDSMPDEKSCWEAVREAKQAYRELKRRVIFLEMREEGKIINLHPDNNAA